MTEHVLVLASGPDTPQAGGALSFARAWLARNGSVTVALIQDAVLVALAAGELPTHELLRCSVRGGARCVYLAEDLARRGFGSDDALADCTPIDDGGLVDLLLVDGSRVAGAF